MLPINLQHLPDAWEGEATHATPHVAAPARCLGR